MNGNPAPTSSASQNDVPSPSGHDWNNRLGRRRFLSNTGKAGAVTILAMHGLKVEVLAEQTSGSANS